MIQGILPLLLCQLLGEAVSRALHLPLPGPVLGLILILLGFTLWPLLIDRVRPMAQGFLSHLSLLFVPAGVGVVGHLDVFTSSGPALLVALIVSTVLAIAVGALTFAAVARAMGDKADIE